MVRRALLWLLPVLFALAFAVPIGGANGVNATAFERAPGNSSVSTLYATLPVSNNNALWSQLSADDDDPDHLAEACETPLVWYRTEIYVPLCSANAILPRAHSTRTAFPRGPPSA